MKVAKVTSGGQLSIPAAVRRRWGTSRVAIDDLGDRLLIRPLPEDPIAAARGALAGRLSPAEGLRRAARRDEASAQRER